MNVWYVCGVFFAVGAVVYVIFASGELQPWAVPPSREEKKTVFVKNDIHQGYANQGMVNDEKVKEMKFIDNSFTTLENTRF